MMDVLFRYWGLDWIISCSWFVSAPSEQAQEVVLLLRSVGSLLGVGLNFWFQSCGGVVASSPTYFCI